MSTTLLSYYQAIENASADMLAAAQRDEWNEVMRLESACAVLIGQLRHAARHSSLDREEMRNKARIMQRILHNDAQIRYLAEPWLADLEHIITPQQTH